METYRLRLSITRTSEADVEILAESKADAREKAAAINVDGLLLRPTNADQIDVLAVHVTSAQKVA